MKFTIETIPSQPVLGIRTQTKMAEIGNRIVLQRDIWLRPPDVVFSLAVALRHLV